MNILHPHGMVERLGDRRSRPGSPPRYGRKKEGSPKNARTLKIAEESDRRSRERPDDDPLRGGLVDLSA
ncbi:MAG: hypothetical protein OEU92_06675 [Alphaproteobacteria bacterium]|nr:hypothetical protein [Alphaproteobacteria bacterium]